MLSRRDLRGETLSCSDPASALHALIQVGHMWRTTKDISMEIEATWADVVENLDETAGLARFAGPGGWNDADMLEVCSPVCLAIACQLAMLL